MTGEEKRRSKRHPTTLNDLVAGERARLVALECNGHSKLRLAELGLNPDTEITVLRSDPGQPLILRVRDSRLAIDRDTARQVRVRLMGRPCGRKRHRRRWLRRRHDRRGRRRRWWW